MKKIEGYDLVNEAGEFKALPAGIYGVKITDVVDVPEREYLQIYCDIVKGEYANYFKTMVDSGGKDNSRTIRSYKSTALPFFKAFITAVEKTNTGYKWDWDEKKLIGKNVVAIFGEEEYLDKDGNVKVAVKIQEFRSLQAFQEGKLTVPPRKKLQESVATEPEPILQETNLTEDDLPF